MADDSDHRLQQYRRSRRPRRLLQAFSSPDSYGLVLLLILVTYALSATATAGWTVSLVLFVQIATIWVTLQAAHAPPPSAGHYGDPGRLGRRRGPEPPPLSRACRRRDMAVISGLLYVAAPGVIVRHSVLRRTVDTQTVLGAIAAYLMVGMSFAFSHRALGALGRPVLRAAGEGSFSQDLFFSFTTLTTTGYGNLVPAANPGQTFAVLEMLTGQLFLVTAVAKVVSTWRPSPRREHLPPNQQQLSRASRSSADISA
jgi:hypothetical protein